MYNGRVGALANQDTDTTPLFQIMSRKLYIAGIILIVLLGIGFYFFYNFGTTQFPRSTIIEIKSNTADSQKNDIFLTDQTTGKSQLVMTVGAVDTQQRQAVFYPLVKANGVLWVKAHLGVKITSIIAMNPDSGYFHQYDLASKNISICDFALNAVHKEIAYNSFCPLEVDDVMMAIAQNLKTPLYYYSLETKSEQIVTTGIAKQYNPVWLNDETLEYDNPNGAGRISSKISR